MGQKGAASGCRESSRSKKLNWDAQLGHPEQFHWYILLDDYKGNLVISFLLVLFTVLFTSLFTALFTSLFTVLITAAPLWFYRAFYQVSEGGLNPYFE